MQKNQKWKSETRLKIEQIECSTYMLTHLSGVGKCIFFKIENWIECWHKGTQLRVHLFRKLLWSNPVGIFSKSVCQWITKLGLLVRCSIFLFNPVWYRKRNTVWETLPEVMRLSCCMCSPHKFCKEGLEKKYFFSVSSINQIQTSTFLAFLLCFLFKSLKMLHLYLKIPGIEWGYI